MTSTTVGGYLKAIFRPDCRVVNTNAAQFGVIQISADAIFANFGPPSPPDTRLTLWPDPPPDSQPPQNFRSAPFEKKFSKRKAFETPLERKFGCKTQK